jgi:hypothetical protein
MLRYLLYALLIWFLYNLIFRFIIPLYQTTRQVKKKFREMHENMENQARQQQGYTEPPKQKPNPAKSSGDYIDFEEIK